MHPLISVYGDTAQRTFPLLLVIGQEPNTDHAMGTHIGGYDFVQHPRCGFWNVAYMLAARSAGMQTYQLKQHCVARGSSPILFADALPIGLRNDIKTKHLARKNVPHTLIDDHVSAILSHKAILDRVDLIILSGLYDSAFSHAKQQLRAGAEAQGLPCIELPFFHGVNSKHIQARLDESNRERIQTIVNRFMQQPPISAL